MPEPGLRPGLMPLTSGLLPGESRTQGPGSVARESPCEGLWEGVPGAGTFDWGPWNE